MSELIPPSVDRDNQQVRPEAGLNLVCFLLDGQAYGIDVQLVREVLRPPEIVAVPGAPGACCGVVNLQGSLVWVLDLRQLLRLSCVNSDAQSLLLIDYPEGLVALRVDSMQDLRRVRKAQIENPSARLSLGTPVLGIVPGVGGSLLILDATGLIRKMTGQVAA